MKFLSTFLSAAVVASSATAFLIPPEVSAVETSKADFSSVVELNCPGCPFAIGEENGNYVWSEKPVDSVLRLNFSLNGQEIFLNNRVIHPMEFPDLHAFYAVQTRKSKCRSKSKSDDLPKQSPPVRMGYALESAPHTEQDGQTWFNLQYTIFDLANKQVHVDTVKISFTYDKEGRIPLMVLDTIPVDQPGSPASLGMDCKNSLCRMRAMIIAKIKQAIQKAKEAAEAAKNSKPVQWVKGCANKFRGGHPHHHGRPDHANRPYHHHKHHEHHRIMHRFHRFIRAIIVPVILGIVAGMCAGAIGVVVGHALAFLWIKCVRGGRRGPYSRIAQQEEAVPEEKEGLINELPPNYEELEGDSKLADDKN